MATSPAVADEALTYDAVVVGGGIVGMSTAWHLLQRRPGSSVAVVEKELEPGTHQTGHNSGVVHSGIYYQPGSLKATLCREGMARTREFAREHGIAYDERGKLLVATDDREVARMHDLRQRATVNGIDAVELGADELRDMEPNVSGMAALFVRRTAITDYPAITRALARLVRDAGGSVVTGAEVTGVDERHDRVRLRTSRGVLVARHAVFCAGLQADRCARMSGIDVDFRIVPFRGEYFEVAGPRADMVQRLVYPIPDPDLPFLGVHLTPDVRGRLTVGPNAVLGWSREGYRKGSFRWSDIRDMATFPGMWRVARQNVRTGARELRNSAFRRYYLRECHRYAPWLELADLRPFPAGIRAQAVMADGSFVHDFLVRRTGRTLHVVNAPSPAATSALPIGERLADVVLGRRATPE